MVPVGMVDYENLGEGSIVDQRYPRKLPGQDELEAQISGLFDMSKWFEGLENDNEDSEFMYICIYIYIYMYI